jgi:hypothetical protein
MTGKIDLLKLAMKVQERLNNINENKAIIPIEESDYKLDFSNEAYKTLEQYAAVSNWFNPNSLVTNISHSEEKTRLLTQLSKNSTQRYDEGVQWQLNKDRRTEVLRSLLKSNQLDGFLNRVLPTTDKTGVVMRDLLSNKVNLDISLADESQLLPLYKALELVSDVDIQKPEIREIGDRIEGLNFSRQYDSLTKDFVGRTDEVRILMEFLQGTGTGIGHERAAYDSLVVTGVGGAGKSTLLGKFMQQVISERLATVCVLDFDKPGVDPNDTNWLDREIIRQVGYQHVDLKEELNELISEARGIRGSMSRNIKRSFNQSESIRGYHSSIEQMSYLIGTQEHEVGHRLLLLLDTLEEVTQRRLLPKLLEWLERMRYSLQEMKLFVIFSGRLYEEADTILTRIGSPIRLPIVEFDDVIAREFLQKLEVREIDITRIINRRKIALRPLELRLIAQILKDNKDLDLDEIENEAGQAGKDLFVGVIYRRVLKRIREENARDLAFPGLVLRYLTVPVILDVLVPTLNLQLDQAEAEEALRALASYGWLAYETAQGEVYHTKDLRRAMLKLMISQDPAKAKEIHKKSIEVFSRPGSENYFEVLYHKLMLYTDPLNDPDFELDDLKISYDSLSTDLPDFPEPARALLRYSRTGEINYDEVHLLPNRYMLQNYDATGENFVLEHQYERALKLYRRRVQIDPLYSKTKQWEVETLFYTVNWKGIKVKPSGYNDMMTEINEYYFCHIIRASGVRDVSFYPKQFDQFLEWTFKTKRNLRDFKDLDSNITFPKLAIAFVFISQREREKNSELSGNIATTADKILQQTFRTEKPDAFNHSKVKALFLFSLLSHSKKLTYTFTTGLVKLDINWLNDMNHYLGDENRILIVRTKAILTNPEYLKSIKNILSRIDSMQVEFSRSKSDFTATIKPDRDRRRLFDLFRGPDSGYRELVKFALLDGFPKESDHRELADLLASALSIHVDDLEPDYFAQSMLIGPELCLDNFVEAVDRTWALDKLLSAATKARPACEKLKSVFRSYSRWLNAEQEAFDLKITALNTR